MASERTYYDNCEVFCIRLAMMFVPETWAVKKVPFIEVGCVGSEGVEMDVWSHKVGQME